LAAPAGTPAGSEELLPLLLKQLRLLLTSPASAAPAVASTTAGTSSLRAAAALALGHAGLPLAAAGAGQRSGAAEQTQCLLEALPDAAGIAADTASLLSDKDPKVAKRAAAALGYLCWAHAGTPAASAQPEAVPAAAVPETAAPAAAPETAAGGGAAAPASGTAAGTAAADAPSGAVAASDAPGGAASSTNIGGMLEASVSALLALRSSKNEEVLFASGEALCFCFGGEFKQHSKSCLLSKY
jgi:hypothetical protein